MAISSQAPQECGEGSTTRARSPDRTVKPHERAATRKCTQCKATKPIDRFSVRQAWCKDCINAYSKKHYRRNLKRVLANKAVYRVENKDAVRAANAKYRKENAEELREYLRRYRQENRAKLLSKKRAKSKEHYTLNKAEYLAKFIARRALKDRSLPRWADLKSIRKFYLAARDLTKRTGIAHEVDHIVPLQSDKVCGLHVQQNLRVITRDANKLKRNLLIEDIV